MTELFKELNIIDILGIGVPGCLLVLLLQELFDDFQNRFRVGCIVLVVLTHLVADLTQMVLYLHDQFVELFVQLDCNGMDFGILFGKPVQFLLNSLFNGHGVHLFVDHYTMFFLWEAEIVDYYRMVKPNKVSMLASYIMPKIIEFLPFSPIRTII